MARLTLRAFGPPDLDVDGASPPPELTWRKHLGLLVYLARSPGGARRRDHLVGLLWPDKDEARARHSLNEACRAIRKALGDDALETRGDQIALDQGRVVADWTAAERALAAGDVAALAAVWRGEFLEGFGIPDASGFEDWLAVERAEWRRRCRDAFTQAAVRASAAGRHAEALEGAEHALRLDPMAEAALRVAMLADALAGAAPAALARFSAYAERLRTEARATPAADLAALAERIRAGSRPADPDAPVEPLPPLVGRAASLAAIEPYLPGRTSRCAVVVITGRHGVGKTRLAREVVERARLEGARVVRLTCVPADADTPGSVLAAVLERGLAAATGLAGAAPEALSVLAALAPDVRRRYPGVTPREEVQSAALGRAFGEALVAVAAEGPVALALDDAQVADERSLAALPAILRAAESARILVLLAVGADNPLSEPLTSLRARVGHDVPGVEVALAPLEDADVSALVAAALPAYATVERERLVRRLRAEAGGTPLFVIEILRALAAQGGGAPLVWPPAGATTAQPLPFPIPGAAAAALTLRAQALDADTRAALLAAAVAGPRPDPALVAALLDTDPEDAERRLARLERAGFLREEDGVWVFTGELVRAFLESELMTSAERRQAHRKAAAALARDGRTGLAYAEHLYAAGAWPEAVAAATASIAAAERAGAGRQAERARRLAHRAAERAGGTDR